MTNPVPNNLYPVANATSSSRTFVDVVTNRNPTSYDNQYQIQQKWFNTVNEDLWYLASFTPTNDVILANWVLITSSVNPIEKLQGNTGGAVSPDGSNIIHTIGDGIGITVAGNPGTNTLTWSLVGGGIATEKFVVDASTAPGTNPVPPTALGLVTVTGGQVPAGTTGNVIQTNSLAANTYTIQVQRSQAVASSTIADNGVSHFNSANFTVDANGFVSFISTTLVNQIKRQVFTSSGTYTPTSGMVYCDIEVVGGGGGCAGCPSTDASSLVGTGGGGGGGYARGIFSAATIGASKSVTVGAAGSAGTSSTNGGTGGTSSVGVLISATGGSGSALPGAGASGEGTGGLAGSGTGGDFQTTGTPGGVAAWLTSAGNSFIFTGFGGSSFFGGGAIGGVSAATPGVGTSYGGGASGGGLNINSAGISGAAGAKGVVIITEYIG